MKRKHTAQLHRWKKNDSNKPYILIGARQTGKTYLLKEFCAENFHDYIYINLDETIEYREIFDRTKNPDEIIKQIEVHINRSINPETTALFIDEIQVSENAISTLKYFNESPKPYKIMCAGSLLGVALNRFSSSYPVGKVTHANLYPMDFEEFLWADNRYDITDLIADCFNNNKKMPDSVHKVILKMYKDYLFIGGMPESVLGYLESGGDIVDYSLNIKADLLNSYMFDMSKYTTSTENIRINKLYYSIPNQLNKDNTKFTYKLIEQDAKKRNYETSIEWLINAGMVLKCKHIGNPEIPLRAYVSDNLFKIYLNDTGLLCELSGLAAKDILTDNFSRYKGMLAENYVAQTLIAKGYDLYYWKSKRNAELDFIVKKNNSIIPIEVKSATNTKAQSLRVYIDKYSPEYSIKISGKNFGFHNNIKSIPLYATYML